MLKAKDVKAFIKDIPDNAQVIFSDGIITFIFDDNCLALNKYGAQWDNGIGYPQGGTVCCGECSHFDCSLCNEFSGGK